jgi:hypothetical protein
MNVQRQLQLMLVGALILGVLFGYWYGRSRPHHDRTKGAASVLVVGCIDPRYAADLAWHLNHDQGLHADYDLITFAGASLGILQSQYPGWQTMFFDHVGLALALHNITEVWCFDHMDCGMYKATLNLKTDEDHSLHVKKMLELKKLIAAKHPELKFKGFIIEKSGSISPAV